MTTAQRQMYVCVKCGADTEWCEGLGEPQCCACYDAEVEGKTPSHVLSPRRQRMAENQTQVRALWAEGKSYLEIAQSLGVSTRTVCRLLQPAEVRLALEKAYRQSHRPVIQLAAARRRAKKAADVERRG